MKNIFINTGADEKLVKSLKDGTLGAVVTSSQNALQKADVVEDELDKGKLSDDIPKGGTSQEGVDAPDKSIKKVGSEEQGGDEDKDAEGKVKDDKGGDAASHGAGKADKADIEGTVKDNRGGDA